MATLQVQALFVIYMIVGIKAVRDEDKKAKAVETHESGDEWPWHSCPKGLRSNKTEHLCYFDGEFDSSVGPEDLEDPLRRRKSTTPLIFEGANKGGVLKVQAQFADEMAVAMGAQEVVDAIGEDLLELEIKHNKTFAAEFKEKMHGVGEMAHNWKPVEFLVVHAGLHLVLELVVHGLHHLAHVGLHGLLGAAEVSAIALPIVGWVLILPMAAYDVYSAYKHYKHVTHVSKTFAARLVLKSSCVAEKIVMNEIQSNQNGFLKSEVGEVCGTKMETMLAHQMQRSNVELRRLLKSFQEVGRCIWPHGHRRWSIANCGKAMHHPLREHHGQPGPLYAALAFGATYASYTDTLLTTPVYKDWFQKEFGVAPANMSSMMGVFKTMRTSSVSDRTVGCMSILATHRAFERLFIRLRAGLNIWIRTYGRDSDYTDIRLITHPHPCKRVFYKLEDREQGFCKKESFFVGHKDQERQFEVRDPCERVHEIDFGPDMKKYGIMLWPESH